MDLFFDYIKSIILGIVEGITEWLPISSTGHMILVNQFIQMKQSAEFIEFYLVVIQLGAILAVVTLYFNKLNPFARSKSQQEKRYTWDMWLKVIVACLPAAVIGLLLDDFLDTYLYNAPTVAVTLVVYGILFIIVENMHRKPKIRKMNSMDYKTALCIGMFQVLSLIPGTSRSGATILGAIILGCSRYLAAEFSFFLAIPVMFGASLLKLVKFIAEAGSFGGAEIGILLVGMAVAYIVSIFSIKFLMGYIRKHDFKAFGWYRIVLGILVIIYFAISGAAVV